ncbi:type 1 glutamine amidotransferase domain-containing protein [Mucilaginibacter sp. OV119]|uniref:type 1 glutamine amidotransferase domain-containing protein n=1 Tax=Mucilaginibacter lappiensis TaxID=354630 RepID=UPI000D865B1F
MKILFIASSAKNGFWLAELTHPYWHLSERGHEIDVASPQGGKTTIDPTSDPYFESSWEKNDLVSKGFLSDKALVAKIEETIALKDIDPTLYDGVHIVGGGGAAVDLYPNEDVKRILEHFWTANKFIGTICHGSIALANIPDKVAGVHATGFSREEDAQVEQLYGLNFIPNFPQPVMEAAGILYDHVEPWGLHVIVTGKLITGQNQQSASEYAIAYNHLLAGSNPVIQY